MNKQKKITKQQFMASILPQKMEVREVASAFAPANIALAKYWGKRNRELNLPTNNSLSISLANLGSKTQLTALANNDFQIYLNDEKQHNDSDFARKIIAFCKLWQRDQQRFGLEIKTYNNIPTAAGLASSASGFAALTLALNDLFASKLPLATLSAIARLGSGSAARSLWHGFVQWQKGSCRDGSDSIAAPLPVTWRELRVGIIIIDNKNKKISSREGMLHTASSSPFFRAWTRQAQQDCQTIAAAILAKDFATLGQCAENNALAMHATMLAARPFITYLQPKTLQILQQIRNLRRNNIGVYATIDAGANVKILFLNENIDAINAKLAPNIIIAPFAN